MPTPDRRLGAALPDLSDLSRLGGHLLVFDSADEQLDSPVRKAAQTYRRAREIAEAFKVEVAHRNLSGHFTEKGLQGQIGELAANELNELSRLREAPLQAQRNDLERLRALMVVVDEPDNDVIAEMQQQEVRSHLRAKAGNDPIVYMELARDFLAKGCEVTAQAVLRGPRALRVISDDQLEELRQLWIEKRDPAKGKLAKRMAESIDAAEAALADTEAMIKKAAGLIDPDPLEVMAAGGKVEGRGSRLDPIARMAAGDEVA